MGKINVELIPDLELGGFTARICGLPAYGEGKTEKDALADLKEAIIAYIEAFGTKNVMSIINAHSRQHLVSVPLNELALA